MRCMLWLFLFPLCCGAQVLDNFGDGDFVNNPSWGGNVAEFEIAGDSLHSIGPQASSVIYLSTPNTLLDSTEWNFLIRLNFNPSSTNQVRVYLASDQADLTGSLNGYYVQFGESGTAPDSLDIFWQSGTTSTKVFTGASGIMTGSTINAVRIKVVRHTGGIWNVYADKTGGSNFASEGTFTDNAVNSTAYFGVVCDYATASRYNLYYFDDFSINYLVSDTTKPTVLNVAVLSATTVDVLFSEPVLAGPAEAESNYSISGGIGNPSVALRDGSNFSLVHLTLANPLQNGNSYSLNLSGIPDLSNNVLVNSSVPFSFFIPGAYDVLINELMADPDPRVGLPSAEFVELYNTTTFPISLGGWKFSDAATTITLPSITLLPDSFVVIISTANADSFPNTMAKCVVSSLPSLNNTGDNLKLHNSAGAVIHTVNYIDDWYNSTVKNDGGWTLELINPANPCQSNNNWTASNDLSGGTPGKRNSVYNTSGSTQFSLLGIEVVSATEITLLFNEQADASSASVAANYLVNNGVGNPLTATLDSVNFTRVHIAFASPLDSALIYTLTATISNCAGTLISAQNSFQFAIPKQAEKFDVLINEIFPDPDPQVGLPAAEYVELYNRSQRAINLKDWELSKAGSSAATLSSYLLLPDSFVIITSTSNGILFASYPNTSQVSSFPSLTNTGDNLLLKNNSGNLIHYVPYTDAWYADEAKKDGGWALELMDTENPCNGQENWRASTDASGGTPGQKNSVTANNPDTLLPRLVRAALVDANTLMLYFSEPLNNGTANVPANFIVNNGVGAPLLALPIPFDYKQVQLEFLTDFVPGTIYTVKALNLTDCSNNPIGMSDTALFAIADTPLVGDIIINEILFNPATSGYDFVELYNRSNKIFDLKQLDIVEKDFNAPEIVLELSTASPESYLLFPGEYVVLTENAENIQQSYFCRNANALVETELPNYDDRESICLLKLHNSYSIDSLAYESDWHYALLDNEDGVSLERIDFNSTTSDKNTWHSAASTVGFATPTYLNSQYSETGISEEAIAITPPVFTPDNDGDKDAVFIQYKFSEPGYTCNVRLYDAKGREIKYLVKQELVGSQGQFQWDGTDDEGRKARIGIYVAYVEIFNLNGKVKRYKKELVLGGKLN